MKKIFVLLPMIAAFAITGCGDKENEEGTPAQLEISEEQAQAKVRAIANTDGIELKYKTNDNGTEFEFTLGAKDNHYWVLSSDSKMMFAATNDGGLQSFEYNEESGEFEKDQLIPSMGAQASVVFDSALLGLCEANELAQSGDFFKVSDTKFLGRNATKYKCSYKEAGASASYEVIVDKETGITLKCEAKAQVAGEKGVASYEVTSFLTGSKVQIPAIKAE